MNRLPISFRTLILAGLVLMSTAVSLRAEPTPPELLSMTGSDIFRVLLKHQGLEPILPYSPAWGSVQLGDSVLVIIGRLPSEQEQVAFRNLRHMCRQVLESGGAVLFATDRASDLTVYLPPLRGATQIDGRTVTVVDPAQAYQGQTDLPFIRFADTPPLQDVDIAAISRLKRVVTNRPSFISAGSPFVTFGSIAAPARIGKELRSVAVPVMAVSRNETMHAVILADAGVLSNQMLTGITPGEANAPDNFEFAMHLASFLVKGPRGLDAERKRTKVIFWENDHYRDDFDRVSFSTGLPEVQPSWEMIQAALAKNIDEKANELQENDWPTRALMRWLTPPPPEPGKLPGRPAWQQIMLWVAPGVAIIVVLLGVRRLYGNRRAGEPSVSKPLPVNHADAGDTLFDKRSQALLNLKNLREPLVESLRSYFEVWKAGAGVLPAVRVQGASAYRSHITKELEALAATMNFPPPQVTKSQWQQWHERADKLQADHAAGLWWFDLEKGNA
ncbi:hypothetical protein BH11PLA2_BH11PLA2_00980 [soil metagenome]